MHDRQNHDCNINDNTKIDTPSEATEKLKDESIMVDTVKPLSNWEEILKRTKHVLAPMVDQSELPWRLLSRRYDTHLCYSPMYHAAIFVRDARYRKEALASCPEDRPLVIQFCANSVENFVQAALLAQPCCDAVDLNLGCPQSIAKRGHYGAFLEEEWDLLAEMVSKCSQALSIPVTCKIRVFNDIEKTVRYAQMLEKAGAKLLTVHGRTKEQKGALMGLASWAHIKAVKSAVKVPVIANGNIQTLADVDRCLAETGCDAVMVAEGNLHNPAIFTGAQIPTCNLALEYLDIIKQYPCPLAYARGHMFKLLHKILETYPEYRDRFAQAKSMDSLRNVVLSLSALSTMDKIDSTYPDDSCWLCQPYNRPLNEEERMERHTMKHSLLNENGDCSVSRNKLKKLKRNPQKSFNPPKEPRFILCSCGMPLSERCERKMCRTCCWQQTKSLGISCFGHKKQTTSERKLRASKLANAISIVE